MIDKYGTALGIFVCGILTYIVTTLWLRTISEYANDDYDHSRNYFSRFLNIISNIFRQIICLIPFPNFTLKIRKLLGYFRTWIIFKLRNELQRAETLSPDKAKHCGPILSLDLELKTVIEKILETYVKSWYCKFSSNDDFIREVNDELENTLLSVGNAASVINKKQLMYHSVELYLRYISHLIKAMENVNCNVKNTYEKCLAAKEEISANFQMEHWAMKDEITEWCYLHCFTKVLAETFGPVEISSAPLLHNVVTEVLTQNLTCPLVDLLSDPDILNMWLLKFMKGYAKENNYISCYNFIANAETPLPVPSKSADQEIETDSTPIISVIPHSRSSDDLLAMQRDTPIRLPNSSSMFFINVSDASSIDSFVDESDPDKCSSNASHLSAKGSLFSDDVAANHLNTLFLAFPPVSVKARSDVNVSGSEFETMNFRKHSESAPPEMINIKRSKSADYIREMPNVSALLPLNTKNHSIRIRGKDNKTFVKLRSHANVFAVETAQEAIETEVPCLFTDVKIINTELQEEPGHSPYTLYCIQYCGVFHNVASAASVPELVQQTVNVKRRFREFLALQCRLDSNPDIRGFLKGIKGPSKWLTTPFTNLDKKNVAERRIFLENYLKELCKRDAIANSLVLQEFLAYGGDASLAFVKRSPDISVPRIDKMIYRGMKGAIDLFKIALPNMPLEAAPFRELDSEVFEGSLDEESSSEYKFKEYLIAFTRNDPGVVDGIAKYFALYELDSSSESISDLDAHSLEVKSTESQSTISSKKLCVSRSSSVDQAVIANNEKDLPPIENLLTDTLVDVGMVFLRSFPRIFKTNRLVFFVKQFLGPFLNSYIDQKIAEIWNKESCATFLHIIHKAAWPEEKSKKKIEDPLNQAKLLNEAVRKIIQAEYGVLSSLLLATNPYASDVLDLMLASFQNKKLNKCLLFHMFDVIAHSLCTEEVKKVTHGSIF